MSASQGEKIIRFQNLYKTYSSLSFTHDYDRPIAVDGIQNRLLKAFGTRGGYGIFDDNNNTNKSHQGLLRRSLLWYRPESERLDRIKFPPNMGAAAEVPSWSWMAYMGEIDFLNLKFGNIDWMDMQSPWSSSVGGDLVISGRVRNITGNPEDTSMGQLYYDIPAEIKTRQMQCVVLGIKKGNEEIGNRRHYFILVQAAADSLQPTRTSQRYVRIGAGYLPGRCISGEGQDIQIC